MGWAAGISAGMSLLGTVGKAAGLGVSAGAAGQARAAAERSAQGELLMGEASKTAADYQAVVAENNALVAEENAKYITESGWTDATNTGLAAAGKVSGIKARQAASGVKVDKGSAVDVRAAAARAGQFDAETVLNKAILGAFGYRHQAANFRADAALSRYRGNVSKMAAEIRAQAAREGGEAAASRAEASTLSGIGSLLSSASSLPFKFGSLGGGDEGGGKPASFNEMLTSGLPELGPG